MRDIVERERRAAPASRPQAIAFDGAALWIGSLDTRRLYALDPATFSVRDAYDAPGLPWGLAATGNDFRLVCGEGAEDDRFIRRFSPAHGFAAGPLPAPDNTGSQLSYDGATLYLSQWYNRRILGLDERGAVVRTIEAPHQICGQTYADGAFYLVTTDDENAGDYWITRIDANEPSHTVDLARVPFPARGLAHDGERFWTNHRAAGETVAFTLAR